MSLQHYLEDPVDSVRRVIPAEHLLKNIDSRNSPFKKPKTWLHLLKFLSLRMLHVLEFLSGHQLFIENDHNELAGYRVPNRRLLAKLIQEGRISKWDCGLRAVDKPAVPYCAITIKHIKNRHGTTLFKGSMQGQGTGSTLDQALTVALAETLERISITEYDPAELLPYTVSDLKKNNVRHFIKSYVHQGLDETMLLNWVRGKNLVDGRSILLPASMVYLNYSSLNPWEPFLIPCTSNGCAAHTDKSTAILKALYENLERDGFLMYWLNRFPPRRIIIDDQIDDEVHRIMADLRSADIDLHFLDCRTEYNVPIIVGVLVDKRTGGVDVGSAAGFDLTEVIKKVATDALRWGVGYTQPMADDAEGKNIYTMEQRGRLWRSGVMKGVIDFFLQGQEISYNEYRTQFRTVSSAQALPEILSLFKARNEDIFVIDLTNELAKTSGLHVVRVVAPSLMPVYFDERLKPLNVPRLYSFGRAMGLLKTDRTREGLNQVPHPFV